MLGKQCYKDTPLFKFPIVKKKFPCLPKLSFAIAPRTLNFEICLEPQIQRLWLNQIGGWFVRITFVPHLWIYSHHSCLLPFPLKMLVGGLGEILILYPAEILLAPIAFVSLAQTPFDRYYKTVLYWATLINNKHPILSPPEHSFRTYHWLVLLYLTGLDWPVSLPCVRPARPASDLMQIGYSLAGQAITGL